MRRRKHLAIRRPQLERLLRRQADPSPEAGLAIAVIALALEDARDARHPMQQGDACRFLDSPAFDFWAEIAGLEPDWVRQILARPTSIPAHSPTAAEVFHARL